MAYFDKDFLAFFKELEKNNNKDWFDANRSRYENAVKKPFKAFVQGLSDGLQEVYPKVDMSDNSRILRINRDIRFSQDKTPYKIHMAALVSPHGKKEMTKPGFFVQANHNDVRVYSGAHGLEKNQLQSVREHIKENLSAFNKLVSDKGFVDTYGKILGEKNKRLAPEFKEVEAQQPLIANKHFYWFFKLKPQTLLKNNLVDELIGHYRQSLPLNQFFDEALA